MRQIIVGCFLSMISVAIASTMSANAQTAGEYIDSSAPQAIEKISGNVVTFRDAAGGVRNYYVPDWMFEKYSLKVGSAMNLYNRNVIQGIYRNTYIDVVSDGLLENKGSFMIDDSRRGCTLSQSPASEGIGSGKRVWYKAVCCPSTIPVVGAMWSYQKREIVAVERSDRPILPAPILNTPVIINEQPPVPALW
jgi:hypothetical protein